MIPRFKPTLGWREMLALLLPHSGRAIERFEDAFARTMGQKHAIAFAYGRSALWAMLKALGLEGVEVVMPAYTCVTVAHAVVLSGNRPVFVDIAADGFNMDLDLLAGAVTERTWMVLPTHLFGFPMDVDRVAEIVRDAEARFGHKIWVVQDCAHAYGAKWQGRLVCQAGDAALFASNIAKYITSIAGGMITSDDAGLAARLRRCRSELFHKPRGDTPGCRRLYGLAAAAAYSRACYGLTWWLEHRTPILNKMTRYYDEDRVDLPSDFRRLLTPVEAAVGCAQIKRLAEFTSRRQDIARRYRDALADVRHLAPPPPVEGATYSHFPATLRATIDREEYRRRMAGSGIDVGRVVEYCVPAMPAYRARFGETSCPRAEDAARRTVNLPISPRLSDSQAARVVRELRRVEVELGRHVHPARQRPRAGRCDRAASSATRPIP